MERTVREEMDLEEEVRRLQENGISTLRGWSLAAAGIRADVHDKNKDLLNTAFVELMNPATTSAAEKLEGYYESVYNASWHHVVEVPGGEGTVMEVKEGEPEQSWTYKTVGRTLEKNDAVQQSGEAPPRLMVLTSDRGWPYTWEQGVSEFIPDCYVNCEVERVWRIVLGDLTKWFSSHGKKKISPRRRVLIGTPGIGKSMNAGSYLLYQLLHYDAEKLQMVAYCFGDEASLFDKTSKRVSRYEGGTSIMNIVKGFARRGVKGYIIYDVALKGRQPSNTLPCEGWGMIVVTPPDTKNSNRGRSWCKRNKS
ncbi:retrotransposon hot spot (RHS) protein, putative [Trypanosoma cruzi]|nr:retrotransposon hot spot (RHS) protein, putative [Trypanosoma cruzi]